MVKITPYKTATKFLASNEIDPNTIEYYYDDATTLQSNRPVISCVNASFSWDDKGKVPALEQLDISFERKSITMIIGETGSGKSALLQGLLGNLHKTGGSIYYNHKQMDIGYSSQTAWIQNATIKDNILFGHKLEKEFYDRVIHICALEDDLKILPAGDETEIGEKGVNLSGGQKQRLSLARAVYTDSEIYIFDDPLSAVDPHVANHIFTECIANHLLKRGKTVVLATHAIGFLEHADNIIVMEDGKVSVQGKLKDLIAANVNLTKLVHSADDDDDDDGNHEAGDGNEKKTDEYETSPTTSPREQEQQKKERKTSLEDGKLVDDEERKEGRVSFDIYKLYMKAGYGPCLLVSFASIALVYLIFESMLDVYWLARWGDSIEEDGTADHDSWYYLGVYVGLRCTALFLLVIQIIVELITRIKAAKYFHKLLLNRVLNAPMSFFDTTPIGRVISRFSKDINAIDDSLMESFKDSGRSLLNVLCIVVIVCSVVPWMLIPLVPICVVYYFLQKYFISTSRELKRLVSISNAPIYSNFSETMSGSKTINAFRRTDDFIKRNEDRVNTNQQARFASFCGYRWYGIRLNFISDLLVFTGGALCAFTKPSAGFIGIVLTMTQHITGSLNWFVDRISQMEQDMVSVERIHQYSEEKEFVQEQSQKIKSDKPLPIQWPNTGKISFNEVFMKYREGLPDVLNGLTFTVKGGEKVGIIGRTGAGKSSLFVTLLRLVEIERGQITIDGEDIGAVELQELRSRISIIPQEPVLFSGNIRFNLDPFNPTTMTLKVFLEKHECGHLLRRLKRLGVTTVDGLRSVDMESLTEREVEDVHFLKEFLRKFDQKLIDALKLSHCLDLLEKNANREQDEQNGQQNVLDIKVEENGSNFSVGERQLICLSRAIIRKSSILLLDEATSSVDAETDKLIQGTIRTVFEKQTILTIAHRIDTILDYDKILIMDSGRKSEFDAPSALLCDKNSKFTQIVQESFGMDAENVRTFLKEHGSIDPAKENSISTV